MLNYLVTSAVRRKLLRLLWQDGQVGTASELARLAGFAFAGVYKELKAMKRFGLASSGAESAGGVYQANRNHPLARVLDQLLSAGERPQSAPGPQDSVLEKLVALGLPVTAPDRALELGDSLECLVAQGSAETHVDPTAARAFPVLLWRVRNQVDYDRLLEESRKRGVKHTVGFMLELTGRLAGDDELVSQARKFRDHRRRRKQSYFAAESKYANQLAERRTPGVARDWGWLMNMGKDAFESTFRKHCGEVAHA